MSPPKPTAVESRPERFDGRAMMLAVVVGIGALAAAFAIPALSPLTGADGKPLGIELQRTFTTAWAAMVTATPAFAAFLFRRTSRAGADWWLAFWTAGCAVFVVHFFWAVAVFFHNDWSHILHSPEHVTVPRLDTVVTAWWVVDVALAWFGRAEGIVVRGQRWIVHVLLLVLFLAGSIKEGNYPASRVVGLTMAACVLVAVVMRIRAGLANRAA